MERALVMKWILAIAAVGSLGGLMIAVLMT